MARPSKDKTPFVVRKSLVRNYLFIAIGAVLALGSLYVLVTSLGRYAETPWLTWGSAVGLAAGTACALLFLHFLPDEKVALRIDEHGLTDNTFALAAGLIPWDEIKAAYEYKVRGASFLVLELRDPEGFAKTLPREAGTFIESRLDQNLPVVEIRVGALNGNYRTDEILDQIRRFKPKCVKAARKYHAPKKKRTMAGAAA